MRKFLLEGDFFVGAALAGTLTKLALRFADAVASEAKGQIKANRFIGEAMLVLASVLHLGQSGLPSKAITNDDADRIALCLKVNILVSGIFDTFLPLEYFMALFPTFWLLLCIWFTPQSNH